MAAVVVAVMTFGALPAVASPATSVPTTGSTAPADSSDELVGVQVGTAPAASADQDASAPATVSVTGTLLTPAGDPLPAVAVNAGFSNGETPIASTASAADGSFTLVVTTEWSFPVEIGDDLDAELMGGWLSPTGLLVDDYASIRQFDPVPGYVDIGEITLRPGYPISGEITTTGLPDGVGVDATMMVPTVGEGRHREYVVPIADGTTQWSALVPAGAYLPEVAVWSHGTRVPPSNGESPLVVESAPVAGVDFELDLSGRTVSGTVVDSAGEPAAGASVSLAPDYNGPPGARYHWTTAGADGSYVLGGVLPGTYRLGFSLPGGPMTYWEDADDYSSATLLEIQSGTPNLEGLDATVSRGGTITGESMNQDGTPRSGDRIIAYRDGVEVSSAYTGSGGAFTLGALPTGEYLLGMEQGGWGGLFQYFDGVLAQEDATVVQLAESGQVDGIVFTARSGASISGTVELADGTPVAGATVRAYTANDQYTPVAEAITDDGGRYELTELNANNYALAVSGGTPLAASRWYGGSGQRTGATAIPLGAESTAVADFSVELGATLSGSVTLPEAETNAWVSVSDADWILDGMSFGIAGEPGATVEWVAPGLPAGAWTVSVSSGSVSESWNDGAPIELAAGDHVDGVDFDLRRPARLAGTVSLHGDPEAQLDGTATLLGEGDAWIDDEWIQDGAYGFADVPEGEYRLVIQARTSDGGGTRVTERTIQVGPEGSPPTTADFEVEPGLPVDGRVIDGATGLPIDYPSIAWRRDTGIGWLTSNGWAYGDALGEFGTTVDGTGPLEMTSTVWGQDYVPSTVDVDVTEDGSSDVVIAMSEGASVSGRVVAENNGIPLSNVSVALVDENGSWQHWATTGSDGRFTVHGVLSGTYTVEYSNYGGLYVAEWHDDQPSGDTAKPITVGDEPVIGLDAALSLGSVIQGTVTEDGVPVPGAVVGLATPAAPIDAVLGFIAQVFGGDPAVGQLLDIEVETDSNGAFRFPALPAGDYAVYVTNPAHRTTWFEGRSTLDTADLVHTDTGQFTAVTVPVQPLSDGESPLAPEQTLSSDFMITLHPEDASAAVGSTVEFRAAASGTPVPSVSWERREPGGSWEALPDEGVAYSFPAEAHLDGHEYRAVFSQGDATLTSEVATLSIVEPAAAPDAPVAPTVTGITGVGADVSWAAPNPNGSAITGYTVRLYEAGQPTAIRTLYLGDVTSLTFAGLEPETDYEVEVTAKNGVGQSEPSERAAFSTVAAAPESTAPGAPTGVTAVAGDGSATVSWTAPPDGGAPITGYTVTASPGGSKVTTSGATSASVTGLVNGTAYTFTVVATNAAGSSAASAPSAPVTPSAPVVLPPVERLAGANRYETSAKISAARFDPGVPVAYVASGLGFPDALSGAPVAGAEQAPVLLVGTGISEVVRDELERLKPGRIVVLGGEGVISASVAAQLDALTVGSVERLAGANRYETSAKISAARFDPGVPVAYVASGLGFPDALSGAPVAGAEQAPVLLVGTGISEVVRDELERLKPGRIVVLGGEGVISASVAAQLDALVVD